MANINVTVSAYQSSYAYVSGNTYTLADTGANIAALTAAEFADLATNGISRINATDNALSLSVAQYQALNGVTLAAGDVIILADSGTNLAALLQDDAAGLADAGIDRIDAAGNELSLTVAHYQALGTVALTSGDFVTLTGTGATLSALSTTDIAALAAAGVDELDATNNVLSLTLAQYQALGTVTAEANDTLTLSGTGASIGALSEAQIAGLAGSGFDKINATDNVLALNVAQYQALGTVQLVAGDVITLSDTGATIAALSDSVFAAMADAGIDKIDATDNVLNLTVNQILGLGTVELASGDLITLADTAAHIEALSAATLATLGTAGVDAIRATDDALSLRVDQAQALGSVSLTAANTLTLADTGANLAALTPAELTQLAQAGFDSIYADNGALTLSLDQIAALDTMALTPANTVIAQATMAQIAALSTTAIAALAQAGVDLLEASDGHPALSVAQAQAILDADLEFTGNTAVLSDSAAAIEALAATTLTDFDLRGIAQIDSSDDVLALGVEQILAIDNADIALTASDDVTLADSGTALAALSATRLNDLAQRGVDKIDASNDTLSLTVEQVEALESLTLAEADTVTLADTGAAIAALSASDLAALAGLGIDAIDVTDGALSLTVAQAQALGTVRLTVTDAVTLVDTAAHIEALTANQIAALATAGIDTLSASDGTLALTVAQAQALGTIALDPANTVTLADDGAIISALSDTALTALVTAGIDAVHATDNALNLTVAKATALEGVSISSTETITLADSGAHIAALTTAEFAALAARGFVAIDATDNTLTLSLEQAQGLNGLTLTAGDLVTVEATGAQFAALTAQDFDDLATLGVDALSTTDHVLSLTVEQLDALGSLTLAEADTVTLADTGAAIAALSASTIGALAGLGIDAIDVTDGALSLTVAQAQALGSVRLTVTDAVTLADTAAHIEALTANQIAALATAGIDTLSASDGTLALTVAQAQELGTIALDPANTVTLADDGAIISALSDTALTALVTAGIDAVHATDNALNLTVAKAAALESVSISSTETITLADSGAHIAALTTTEFAALAARGFVAIDATDNTLTLSLEQAQGLNGLTLTAGDLVTVEATGAQFAALTAQDFDDLATLGVDALSTTDHVLSLTVEQLEALGSLTLAEADTVTLADTAATIAALSANALADLIALGIDHVAATDGILELSAAQALALDGATLSVGSLIVGNAATLGNLTAADWTVLAGINADAVQVSDNTLTLDVAKVLAMGALNLSNGDMLTVIDTGATLAGLSVAQLTALAEKSQTYVEIDASDDSLVLDYAQFDACRPIAFANSDMVTVADLAETLNGLTAEDIAYIAARDVYAIAATDGTLVWSLEQVTALDDTTTIIAPATEAVVELTPAELAAITTQDLADLANRGIDLLTTTDGAPVLTVAQFQALATLELLTQDTVTLADTGAALANLDAIDIAGLKDAGIDVLSATDGTLALSFTQFEALHGLAIDGDTAFVLRDSGATIADLSTDDFDALNAAGVTRIDASDDILVLSVAQARALGDITLSINDTVSLVDSAAAIGSLNETEIAALIELGVSEVEVTDDAVTLTVAQLTAMAEIDLMAPFGVELADSGATLSALSAQQWQALLDRGVAAIDVTQGTLALTIEKLGLIAVDVAFSADSHIRLLASALEMADLDPQELEFNLSFGIDELGGVDGTLSLTKAQFDVLDGIALVASDTVTLALDADDFATLSLAGLVDLSNRGIDALDMHGQTVTVTIAKASTLGAFTVNAGQLTLQDDAADIGALTAEGLGTLIERGVTTIVAHGGALSLNLEQANALLVAQVTVSDDDGVVLQDSAAAIAALSPEVITALAASGFTMLDADGALTLSLAQALNLGGMALGNAYPVTVQGSGEALSALSVSALEDLADAGVATIDATDNAITFSLDQLAALDDMALAGEDVITLFTNGTSLAALAANDLAALVEQSVDRIAVSGGVDLSLEQLLALDGAHFAADATVTLVASGATLVAMSDGDVALVRDLGLTRIIVTDHAVTLSALRAYDLSGLNWDQDASLTLQDTGAAITGFLAQYPDDFASLPVASLDATDNSFTLSLAQLAAIEGIAIGADDYINVADTGANLAALTSAQIEALAARKVVQIDATDSALTLSLDTWASYQQNMIAFTQGSHVVVADSGASLAQFSDTALAALGESGVTRFDASEDLLVLSYDQFLQLENVALTAQDTVKVWFNGDTLATLTTDDIATLVAAGVDMITALAPSLTVDLATLNNLVDEGMAFDPEVLVRLTIDAGDLVSFLPEDIAGLAEAGVDAIYASGALSLSIAQFAALGMIAIEAGDGLTLADNGEAISGLTPEALATLADRGVGVIDATDGVVHLTLDQLDAMGSIHIAGNDLAVADLTVQQAADFTSETRALLGLRGIDTIAIAQGTLSLGLADLARYADFSFTGGNVVLGESGATLAGLSASDLADLAERGITVLDATDDSLVLSLAQFVALGDITLNNADDVTITATAAHLAALSPAVFAAMSASGVDTVEVSGGALQLSAAQAVELGNVQLSSSAAITLVDTGAAIAALSADTIGGLGGSGVTAIDATTGITINAVKYEALGGLSFALSDVVTVASNHSFTMGADVDNVTLTGTKNLVVTGNSGANVITGNAGRNTLDGGTGNDRLTGGAGRDVLTGGGGADKFIFRDGDFGGNTATTADRITDFSRGSKDLISLIGVDADSTTMGDQDFAWIGNTAFHHVAGELRFAQISGNTYVQGDTNGDGLSDFWIRLDGLVNLQATDFQL